MIISLLVGLLVLLVLLAAASYLLVSFLSLPPPRATSTSSRNLDLSFKVAAAPWRVILGMLYGLKKQVIGFPGFAVAQSVPRHEPGEAVIRMSYAGICASDISIINGKVGLYGLGPMFPFSDSYIGHENVGVVVEGSSKWKGKRVVVNPNFHCRGHAHSCSNCSAEATNLCTHEQRFGDANVGLVLGGTKAGSWSSYYTVNERNLHLVPDDVADKSAVLAEPLAVAIHSVECAKSLSSIEKPTILVVGMGIIGLLTVVALKHLHRKSKVIVVARYPHQIQAAQKLGCDGVISNDIVASVARETGGKLLPGPGVVLKALGALDVLVGGVDVVIDTICNPESISTSVQCTRFGGEVVYSGLPTGKISLGVSMVREVSMIPSWLSRAESFDTAFAILSQRDLSFLVTHEFALSNVEEALAAATSKAGSKAIKVVFVGDRST